MSHVFNITEADYLAVQRVMQNASSGTYVKYQKSSGKIEQVWVESSCQFNLVPAGIKIEKWFSGKNKGQGFRIYVTPRNTGTVEIINARVAK